MSYTNPIALKLVGDNYDLVYGVRGTTELYHQFNVGFNSSEFLLDSYECCVFFTKFKSAAPGIIDYDNDGVLDLLVGDEFGEVHLLLRQNGSFSLRDDLIGDSLTVSGFAKPTSMDLDLDGDTDIIVGDVDGKLSAFLNINTPTNPVWEINTDIFAQFSVVSHATPTAIDPNNDGIYDLVVGSEELKLTYLRNNIDPQNDVLPNFENIPFSNKGNPFNTISFSNDRFLSPFLVDFNGDGFLDLLIGNEAGTIDFAYNFGFDMTNVENIIPPSGLDTLQVLLIVLFVILLTIGITSIILHSRFKVRGDPIFLMVVHSIGISPYKFEFTKEIVSDTILAGGAFVGIQNIIKEITGSKDLNSFDAGDNKILITRTRLREKQEDEIQILLWATDDDPELRQKSQELADFIVANLASYFEESGFDREFDQQITRKIMILYDKWIKDK